MHGNDGIFGDQEEENGHGEGNNYMDFEKNKKEKAVYKYTKNRMECEECG